MFCTHWFRVIASTCSRSGRRRPTPPRFGRRRALRVEPLEDRTVPSFLPPVSHPTDAGPISVVVGDFNADGVPDLVTPNFQAGSVSVLLGNGDGSFQDALNFAVNRAFSVAVGEFNGDGIQDLAVGTLGEYPLFEDSGISILLGNGDGTFQDPYRVLEGKGGFPVVGDLNGDGHLDFVEALAPSSIGVLLGNGDGTFEFSSFHVGGSPSRSVLGDLNNDGHLDLVGVSAGHNFVLVLLGNGDGSFQTARQVNAGPLPNSVALADVNLDGTLDLVTSNQPTVAISFRSTVSVLRGNGDGTFQAAVRYDLVAPVLARPQQVVVGDFNGDGIPDLAALVSQVQPGSRTVVSVLLGRGDGSFQSAGTTDVERGAQFLVAADLNGDGLADVVTANFFFLQSSVSVLLNDGDWPAL